MLTGDPLGKAVDNAARGLIPASCREPESIDEERWDHLFAPKGILPDIVQSPPGQVVTLPVSSSLLQKNLLHREGPHLKTTQASHRAQVS